MLGVLAALLTLVALPSAADAARQPKITNGQDASPGEYPYMVALVSSGTDDNFQGQFCGGSIIDADWVLTAAHCVVSNGDVAPADSIDVLVGAVDLTADEGTRIPAAAIVAHPDYDEGTTANDIALIQLTTATDFAPVAFAGADDLDLYDPGTSATLTGWGGTTSDLENQEYAEVLQEGTMPVIDDDECVELLNAWDGESGDGYDEMTMMCAGAPEDDADGGVDACFGDSGGPLVVTDNGVRVQIGVVSWGPTCGNTPSAYSRVTTYTDFINEVMETGGDPDPDPDPTNDGQLDNTERVAGASRFATAAEIAQLFFTAPVDAVFVVTGASYPDALASAPAALTFGAPVLLTDRDVLSPETAAALEVLDPGIIYVVGGGGAVSSGVMSQLQQYTAGDVVRIAGENRYETAVALSQLGFPDGLTEATSVMLASGETFADALSAAAAAAVPPPIPLLLTARDSLPQPTRDELTRLGPDLIFIVGGTAAVSASVESELAAMGIEVIRIAGDDRYETSAEIVSQFFGASDVVLVATGTNFPDGLVAGALGLPLVLVPPGSTVPGSTADAVEGTGASELVVLGGTGAISDAQAYALDELVGG